MARVPAKLPNIVKHVFPSYTWSKQVATKTIYLTFDDGPTPEITPWVLDQLKQHHAKATFFCIGNNVAKHPETYQQLIDQGHAVGNHTFNHLKGWKTSPEAYIDNVLKAATVIQSKLFRPPYGQLTRKQGKMLMALGYHIIMWDVLSIDWDKHLPKEQCLKNILKHTKPGSIVVFHDSIKAQKNMQYALPRTLAYFSEKGYQFKALPH
ncbi:polysaccharide deacetylase [Mangrovimonas yunxiaonensis]|uniref:Polysaccharide deacetylase n=1 Tax=Mangrovimonas yunxiaonensis TaxID=1197477 RepID=A0A084TMH2_9FLAO|nr:polysaccharide deacetylase family protein [Mangrovimonas yunxiaonensis]KFB01908.1 polysaccharide deacetylase [Mangrovimonas yunxiaonensis]GGH44652.1 polysaccharide deacetylase [Mangrovimonas yunxiaonensis]